MPVVVVVVAVVASASCSIVFVCVCFEGATKAAAAAAASEAAEAVHLRCISDFVVCCLCVAAAVDVYVAHKDDDDEANDKD